MLTIWSPTAPASLYRETTNPGQRQADPGRETRPGRDRAASRLQRPVGFHPYRSAGAHQRGVAGQDLDNPYATRHRARRDTPKSARDRPRKKPEASGVEPDKLVFTVFTPPRARPRLSGAAGGTYELAVVIWHARARKNGILCVGEAPRRCPSLRTIDTIFPIMLLLSRENTRTAYDSAVTCRLSDAARKTNADGTPRRLVHLRLDHTAPHGERRLDREDTRTRTKRWDVASCR